MQRTDVVVIGAGQAGLAASACLTGRGIDHVVLERGRVGERWRSERWDSLRLLTPNWQSRLPGFRYAGPDPDGFMAKDELVDFLGCYARSTHAPVQEHTTVLRVSGQLGAYEIDTDRGPLRAAAVIVATGACDRAAVPGFASRLSTRITQVVPSHYRRPSDVPEGGVLVVGASATGVQLADELSRAGRRVTLAVGRHTRLPRTYRGRDIMWWLEAMGVLGETSSAVRDLERAKRAPSLQLVGRPDRSNLDLSTLASRGVRVVGRATDANGHALQLAPDLGDTTERADTKLSRLLSRVDDFATEVGLDAELPPSGPPTPTRRDSHARTLDLRAEDIHAVVWATGFRRRYPWLAVPVLDEAGEISHRDGLTPSPGLYALGLRMLRTRRSTFLDGVGPDARFVVADIAKHLNRRSRVAA